MTETKTKQHKIRREILAQIFLIYKNSKKDWLYLENQMYKDLIEKL